MTIDDCGGRREDIDSVEIINRINGDNGMIDMNEEERNWIKRREGWGEEWKIRNKYEEEILY